MTRVQRVLLVCLVTVVKEVMCPVISLIGPSEEIKVVLVIHNIFFHMFLMIVGSGTDL